MRTLKINSNKTKTNDCEAFTRIQMTNKFHLMKLIVLIAVVLSISSLCLLKPIATARGELKGSLDSSGLALEGSGSVSSQSMENMANNLQQQGQQLFDPNNMLEYGLNSAGSALKYFVPNTYQALSSDMGNGYAMLANGANQGLNALQSQYGSFSNQLSNRYNSLQQNNLNRQEQLFQQQEALLSRMYDIVANPEQFCRQLADRRQQSSQQANQMLDQATKGASSFMNTLSSSFPVFG